MGMGKMWTVRFVGAVLFLALAAEATYYNEEKLTVYARLSQQLRYQMGESLAEAVARATAINTVLSTILSSVSNKVHDMKTAIASFDADLEVPAVRSNKYMVTSMKAYAQDPFPGFSTIQFNIRDMDHGFDYDVNTGDAIFPRSGVYMLELKNQGTYHVGVKMKFRVFTPTGTMRYNIYYYTDWEVSPYLQTLTVEAGDRLDTLTLGGSGNYQNSLIAGPSNQIHVRYLGRSV